MITVKDVLKHKGHDVTTVSPDATVLDASLMMNQNRIGALVVVNDGGIAGIFTERDVLRRVVAERRDPSTTRVADVMTHRVVVCDMQTRIDEARKIFQSRRIRHLPVVDGNEKLAGMISIGDLNAWELNGQEVEIKYLHEYILGVVA